MKRDAEFLKKVRELASEKNMSATAKALKIPVYSFLKLHCSVFLKSVFAKTFLSCYPPLKNLVSTLNGAHASYSDGLPYCSSSWPRAISPRTEGGMRDRVVQVRVSRPWGGCSKSKHRVYCEFIRERHTLW